MTQANRVAAHSHLLTDNERLDLIVKLLVCLAPSVPTLMETSPGCDIALSRLVLDRGARRNARIKRLATSLDPRLDGTGEP